MKVRAPFRIDEDLASTECPRFVLSLVGSRYARWYEKLGIFSLGLGQTGPRGYRLNFDPLQPASMKYRIGHRVWVLLRGERSWKGTIWNMLDESNASPAERGYQVHCDPDYQFPDGCSIFCKENELERIEIESRLVN